ncbi:MAG TPA: tetratricopeptide repeat protein [Sphingomicrobium sp.]|nr:tetratricopeptide repeat protein [Sphingomicrobium sp.]
MKSAYLRFAIPAALVLGLSVTPALAQRQPTPEQRIDRLERQLQQVQRQIFPRGRPADTAGFIDEPAATQSAVMTLDQRLMVLERQLAEMLRLAEENGHRVATMESELGRLRSDQDRRFRSLESALADAQSARAAEPAPVLAEAVPAPLVSRPRVETTPANRQPAAAPPAAAPAQRPTATQPALTASSVEAGEAAYDEGFQLWRAGKYDQAIAALRAMASSFPGHRRVSWANNLAGRALLDKGQPRAAAEALLANYRSNPRGERAADSLFYLGQALAKLGQASQACKAYAELEEVYPNMRAELRGLLPKAKSEAKCG